MTLDVRLSTKPRAGVTAGWDEPGREGWVDVWCDDREAAALAAIVAARPWAHRDTDTTGRSQLRVAQPSAGTVVRHVRAARDAAAETLRGRGYSLRGRSGT